MPLRTDGSAPTLFIRKAAFERAELTRQLFDEALNLTDEEFRVEGELIAIGPLVGDDAISGLIDALERAGLIYFDDFFELSGNWPEWLVVFTQAGSE